MKKNISFMRNIYTSDEKKAVIDFMEPLFEQDYFLFRKMIQEGTAYIQEKRFTYILHQEAGKKYRVMGNCIGPVIYIRDILNIDDPDDAQLEP